MTSPRVPSVQPRRLSTHWLDDAATYLGYSLNGLKLRMFLYGLRPLPGRDFPAQPTPAADYDEAVARFAALQAAEHDSIDPICYSRYFGHGRCTDWAYILIHGLTNSPLQFVDLARMLHARGHNVIVPLMPYHGRKSHDVRELAVLTADDLRDYADASVDMAAGLGRRVGVVGVSGGANVATWIAQNRGEVVGRSLLVAPFITTVGVSRFVSRMLANSFAYLPNVPFEDPREIKRTWVYRGQSSRGIFAVWELIRSVMRQADYGHAPAGEVGVLMTGADETSDNGSNYELIRAWRANGGRVSSYEFDAALDIAHNSIDPAADAPKRALVHAKMLEMIGEEPDPTYDGVPQGIDLDALSVN